MKTQPQSARYLGARCERGVDMWPMKTQPQSARYLGARCERGVDTGSMKSQPQSDRYLVWIHPGVNKVWIYARPV